MKTAQEIADFLGGTLHGNGSVAIQSVGSLERGAEGTLAYAEGKHVQEVASTRASCVLVPSGNFPDRTHIVVEHPRLAFARAAQWLIPDEVRPPGVHATAIIEAGAEVGRDVSIGAWTIVEAGVRIGRGSVVYPGCYIGKGCRVGDECVLYPRVVLYPATDVGDRVIIHAGAVIGSDGFGFVFDGTRHVKIRQVGRTTIGADVEIGANSCIDRGALDETLVDEGVKIDNLCQIAHNVRIGAHATISSQTGIAGSSTIGRRATIAGQVGIADGCRIDDDALVGAQCGVPTRKRVPAGDVFWGTPARPLKTFKTQQAHLSRLPSLAAEVKRLRTELDELKAKLG